MKTLSKKKKQFLIDHLTEILHKNLSITAFSREDESNQQLLRLYKTERTLIFGRILIGTIHLRYGNGSDCFPNFSTLIFKFSLNLTSLKRSNILKNTQPRMFGSEPNASALWR